MIRISFSVEMLDAGCFSPGPPCVTTANGEGAGGIREHDFPENCESRRLETPFPDIFYVLL